MSFDGIPWINPIGGLGDVLMISGVLKQVVEREPDRRFRLIRRPGYMNLLEGHPAVVGTGFPRPGEPIQRVDYWSDPGYAEGLRPMQILARMFGTGPVTERFFVREDDRPDPLLDRVPWGERTAVIAPESASVRKEWRHERWEELAAALRGRGWFVLQMGRLNGRHARDAYSICGLTTPKQVFAFLRRASLVVTVDNFFVHAAHHVAANTVALWGATDPATYGYPEQRHLVAPPCDKPDGCIAPGKGENYTRPCPLETHCLDAVTVESVLDAIP